MSKNPSIKKALQFYKYLDISTGHVMEADLQNLEHDDCPITAYPYEEGCWVHVDNNGETTFNGLLRLGFSEGFAKVYMAAVAAKCQWIKFDCDGWQYERFEHYDW